MHRFVGLFIGLLVLVDAFFIAYAIGINVRKTTVVDPSLPIKAKVPATIETAPSTSNEGSPPEVSPSTSTDGPVVNDTAGNNKTK